MLKPFWNNLFSFGPRLGLWLVLLLGIPRFILVMRANVSGNYNLIAVIFMAMLLTPFIFLTKAGRRNTGMKKPANRLWILYAFFAGGAACLLMFLAATFLFDETTSNWFVYISRTYRLPAGEIAQGDKFIFFLVYAVVGMTFSPVGEELFYRGIVHESFAVKYGDRKASIIDSLAFALTHLAHFGIVYQAGGWTLLFFPALLWVTGMYLCSRLFYLCRKRSGSITGAIVCHAAYNLAMMYFIFYHIL